ncbi:hypothetical protein CCR75_008862 [Bremia lactucae]|uniref:Uncharacterized protein n=1 Tax=Bremia lactucae TaxID=4779 RepID=A0A976FMZ8_BRELC|nr:hypothetical protein CCR75_008862 [Bremia lactucae]
MPNAPTNQARTFYPRQVPTDSLLAASEAELASSNFDALRNNALKLAPTPAAPSELHRMWIPCPMVIRKKHLAELLEELATDTQPQIWKDARQARLLQDFLIIPNAGVRFTCASYDMASKLSQVSLKAFGSTIQIARFSKYGSRYYIDLVRLPDEITDRTIFDWFESRGAPPTCILPTYMRNGLPSRERTVYFAQDQAPEILVPSPNTPLREISFPSPDDGMVDLRPCFINHKVARYNRVTPPSIRLRHEQVKAKKTAEDLNSRTLPRSPSGDLPPGPIHSSLRQSLKANHHTEEQHTDGDDAMSDSPPAYDNADDDFQSNQPVKADKLALRAEKVFAPISPPDAPLWLKAAKNRKALSGISNPGSVEIFPLKYTVSDTDGSFQAEQPIMA